MSTLTIDQVASFPGTSPAYSLQQNLGMRLNSGTLNHAVPVPKYRNSAVIARIGQVSASCPVEETVGTLGQ